MHKDIFYQCLEGQIETLRKACLLALLLLFEPKELLSNSYYCQSKDIHHTHITPVESIVSLIFLQYEYLPLCTILPFLHC